MFRILGDPGKDLCDRHLKPSRRDFLRVGGGGMIGLTLSSMLELKAKANQSSAPGWGKAKSIIMVYLQGGPSHLDLWDPKKMCPITSDLLSTLFQLKFQEYILLRSFLSLPRLMTSSP